MEENVRKAIAAIEAQQEKVTERSAGARIDRNKLEQLV